MKEPKVKGRGTINTERGMGEEYLGMVDFIKDKVPAISPIFDKLKATFEQPYNGPRPACLDALISMSEAVQAGCPPKILEAGYSEFIASAKEMSREDVEILAFAFMVKTNTLQNTAHRTGLPDALRELIEGAAKDGKLNVVTDNETAAQLRADGVDLGPNAAKESLN